jgi:hypothetical protein
MGSLVASEAAPASAKDPAGHRPRPKNPTHNTDRPEGMTL